VRGQPLPLENRNERVYEKIKWATNEQELIKTERTKNESKPKRAAGYLDSGRRPFAASTSSRCMLGGTYPVPSSLALSLTVPCVPFSSPPSFGSSLPLPFPSLFNAASSSFSLLASSASLAVSLDSGLVAEPSATPSADPSWASSGSAPSCLDRVLCSVARLPAEPSSLEFELARYPSTLAPPPVPVFNPIMLE
jgi:hypothetical protein